MTPRDHVERGIVRQIRTWVVILPREARTGKGNPHDFFIRDFYPANVLDSLNLNDPIAQLVRAAKEFSRMKLVIHPAVDDARLAAILAAAAPLRVVNCDRPDEALAEITDADAFFGKITPELLRVAQQLQWIQAPTASLEHYLFPALIDHPCRLSNMRGLFSDVVADHALTMVLCFARNFHVYLRQTHWAPVGNPQMTADFVAGPGTVSATDLAHQHLSDLALGVVGTGSIGREILRRAHSFGMALMGADPVVREIPELSLKILPMDRLNELLARCDYVVIAAPHTPETERLFCRPLLQQMKRSAVLINIGRGAIVDLADLTAALEAGDLRGAGLDVFEIEPLPADHPLWSLPNVIVTPHVAASSPRIAERHLATLLENIRRFVRGEEPATLVEKRKWY
jgi:phosphoglycerate dehydrogenase-like enzyme